MLRRTEDFGICFRDLGRQEAHGLGASWEKEAIITRFSEQGGKFDLNFGFKSLIQKNLFKFFVRA